MSGPPKYARRRDGNHKQIEQALRAVCRRVWCIHEPLDILCVSRGGHLFLVEVKDRLSSGYRRRGRSDQKGQTALLREAKSRGWRIFKVETIEGAVEAARMADAERPHGP